MYKGVNRAGRTVILRSLAPILAALVAATAPLSSSANATQRARTTGLSAPAPTSGLVFATYRNALSTINAINANGSGKRQLTTPQRSFQGQPAYSPDGSKLAYICGNFELCVMNADGSGQGRLTTSQWPRKWAYVDHPTWSADGTKIAFASNADGTFHVYVINADGTGLHKLPGTTWNDDDPSWSPDGTKIAFDRYRSWSSGSSAIYVMNADGTQPRRLSPKGVDGWGPSWAPDGTQVTFSGYEGDYAHLFIVNSDGSDSHQLTRGVCEETNPAWTPDETALAFERNCGDRLGIAYGQFGGQIIRITAPKHGFDLYPEWQPKPTSSGVATSIGPPSTPTRDARLVSTYFYWGTQVGVVDFLPAASVRLERRTIADDRAAVAALNSAHPDTRRGKQLRANAIAAFRLDAAASREYLLSIRADAQGKSRAAARHERIGEKLARRSGRRFDAADNLANLPY
jgi:Tol biopolymer transport system component